MDTTALSQLALLTDIDVKVMRQNKLGLDVLAHRILGVHNPPPAHCALTAKPDIGLLPSCDAVVEEDAAGDLTVGFINPVAMPQLTDNPEVRPWREGPSSGPSAYATCSFRVESHPSCSYRRRPCFFTTAAT